MTNKTKKVKKKRFNFKKFIILSLFVYVIFYSISFIFREPIRHIKVNGNNFLSDAEIIRAAKLEDYPSYFKYMSSSIEKKIKKLDLISEVDVKKRWGFVVEINVEENKFLFYNSNNDKVYLSDGKLIDNNFELVGVPTLVNNVNENILKSFINKFKEVDSSIIFEINEIIYEPSFNVSGDIIDENRFKVIMNDGNHVYVSAERAEMLNYYNEIYASINDKKGTLYLDSGDYGNFGFTPFGSD